MVAMVQFQERDKRVRFLHETQISAVRAAVDMLKHTQALEGLPASLQPFPVGRSVRYSDRGGAIMFHVKKRPNIFISVRGHEAFRFRRFSSLLSLRALFL